MTPLLTVLAQEEDDRFLPVTSFGNEPLWLTIGKAVFVFVLLVLLTLFTIVFERKVVARMQQRSGPNRVGPGGWGQSLADGLKLAFKEDIVPALANKPVYLLAPVLSAVPAFLAFSVIPFGPRISVAGEETALQLTDLSIGVLFILACTSLGVYGLVLAGWSSGSPYPLLGGLRSTAQVISYEIAMALALIAVFLYAGSLSTSEIVAAQQDRWFILTLPVSFALFAVAMVGETNRAPFDLPEAESELVGGFHTEYTSLKFAMFFLAEYIAMVTVSALAVTLFLGGWQPIWPFSEVDWMSEGWFPLVWFLLKTITFLFVFVWLRGVLPRMRYDTFMRLGWKVLVPVGLVWILLVAAIRAATLEIDDRRTLLLAVGGVFAVVLLVFALVPAPKKSGQIVPQAGEDESDDGLVPLSRGGFPVPPLDLQVPPTPRSLERRSLQGTGAGSGYFGAVTTDPTDREA